MVNGVCSIGYTGQCGTFIVNKD